MNDNAVFLGNKIFGLIHWEDDDVPWMWGDFVPGQDFDAFVKYLHDCEDIEGQQWLDFYALNADGISPDLIRWGCDDTEPVYLHCLCLCDQRTTAKWRSNGNPIELDAFSG